MNVKMQIALEEVAWTVTSVIRKKAVEVAAVGPPGTVRAAAITTATAGPVVVIEEIATRVTATANVIVTVIVMAVVCLAGKVVEAVGRERGAHEVTGTGIVVATRGIAIEATVIITGPQIVTGQIGMMTVVAGAEVEVAVVGRISRSLIRIRYLSPPYLALA